MRILIAILLVALLCGCNSYHIKRCEGAVCAEANIKSMRKFSEIRFAYNRDTGQFELHASDVSTDVSAVSALANLLLLQEQQKSNQ